MKTLTDQRRAADAVAGVLGKIAACRSMIDALEDEIFAITQCVDQGVVLARERAKPTRLADMPDCASSQPQMESVGFASLRRPLSPRQLQMLEFLRRRLTSREIACELGLRRSTIGGIRQVLYNRLGVHDAAQALVAACQLGLLDDQEQPVQST
jgi:DNA-binding NarL/FixJ family response regulator